METNVNVESITKAYNRIKHIAVNTPLQRNDNLSDYYGCNVFLKREDLQKIRSYKIRGAYNFICELTDEQKRRGVVAASAGNHAQGVAFSCSNQKINGKIFMPATTPKQKITQTRKFGKEYIDIILVGDTFDESYAEARAYAQEHNCVFIHPFDDPVVISGQGTIAVEIFAASDSPIDYLFVPVGGGGLIAGVGTYAKAISPATKIIAVEPLGASSLKKSFEAGKVVSLDRIDKFVDGAAVKRIGDLNYEIAKQVVDDIILVPEGKTCSTILSLYNNDAIVLEPAGALSISALDDYKDAIKGKNVVCIVSGGNNDIDRMAEIKERSLIYEGLKYYFIIRFPQRSGALREFVNDVLGEEDDVTHFEYIKKTNKDEGPALVGIEVKHRNDFSSLIERLKSRRISFTMINDDNDLFNLLI